MSEIMMEDPAISDDPCLEGIHHFEQSIQNRKMKCLDMLMVVIPGTDESLGKNTDNRVYHEK
jgi:hypothetical protein